MARKKFHLLEVLPKDPNSFEERPTENRFYQKWRSTQKRIQTRLENDPLKVLKVAVRHLEAKKLSKYFDVKSWDPVQKKLAYELKQVKVDFWV